VGNPTSKRSEAATAHTGKRCAQEKTAMNDCLLKIKIIFATENLEFKDNGRRPVS
jgi:hypothetical protein